MTDLKILVKETKDVMRIRHQKWIALILMLLQFIEVTKGFNFTSYNIEIRNEILKVEEGPRLINIRNKTVYTYIHVLIPLSIDGSFKHKTQEAYALYNYNTSIWTSITKTAAINCLEHFICDMKNHIINDKCLLTAFLLGNTCNSNDLPTLSQYKNNLFFIKTFIANNEYSREERYRITYGNLNIIRLNNSTPIQTKLREVNEWEENALFNKNWTRVKTNFSAKSTSIVISSIVVTFGLWTIFIRTLRITFTRHNRIYSLTSMLINMGETRSQIENNIRSYLNNDAISGLFWKYEKEGITPGGYEWSIK